LTFDFQNQKQKLMKILQPYNNKGLSFKNHLVMAPMTRSRAIGNIPNDLMAEYYGQRAGAAGLIVTEGTSPAPEGLGYPRIPGAFSPEQTEGWRKVAAAAHAGNSKIFMQLMHTGRVGHRSNLPAGYEVMGASDVKAAGQIYSDTEGMQDHPVPVPFTTQGVKDVIAAYVHASKNAVAAGFDGVELHSANGYLMEQFLNPGVNTRTDEYGGSIQARAKFVLDIARDTAAAIGKEKVGIRFSPYSGFNDMPEYAAEDVHATYAYLAEELSKIGIAYIHLNLGPAMQPHTLDAIRTEFTGTLILCGGYTPETAEEAIETHKADLIAFGRSFLANPDLDKRIAAHATLAVPDFSTLYTPGPVGLTDYPVMA